jgi:hemoglobin
VKGTRNAVTDETAEDRLARRQQITDDIVRRTGIDEAMIRVLVSTFYGRVRQDDLIGPIFNEKVEDWDAHIEKLCAFWSSVALLSGRYHGQPMRVHLPLPIGDAHFERWLGIFEATAAEICPPAAASHFVQRARQIADSLLLGVRAQRGEIIAPRWASTAPAGSKADA